MFPLHPFCSEIKDDRRDSSVIGKKIKELEKGVGVTQGGLADGICTQALISRIEKGDIFPGATVLYQISNKTNTNNKKCGRH